MNIVSLSGGERRKGEANADRKVAEEVLKVTQVIMNINTNTVLMNTPFGGLKKREMNVRYK